MKQLLYWMRTNDIGDQYLWKNAAISQEIFVRDQICMNLLHVPCFVISTHCSKSITLPVYGFKMKNGIKVMCRENFYGWCVSVELPRTREEKDFLPDEVIGEHLGFFEGFEDDWVHTKYDPKKKQKKFSFSVHSDYDFYMLMYFFNRMFEPVEFSDEPMDKEEIEGLIKDIYKKQGHEEYEPNDWGGKSRVMSGFELLWWVFKIFDDCDFRKKNGFEERISTLDISNDPKQFADYISRAPEMRNAFREAVWHYNEKY